MLNKKCIYFFQFFERKKERIKTKLNIRDCLIKGYTYLYPKCKYVMHIDVDNFDINDMYELTDIPSINNFYLDGQDYSKVHCTSDYSAGYLSNDVYDKLYNILSHCPLDISGNIVVDKSSPSLGRGRVIFGFGKTKLQNALEKIRYVDTASS